MRTTPRETIAPAVLTVTEYAVLGLLSTGEQSGYDLKKRADRSVGYFWSPAKSRIYAILPRLVDAGLVRRRDVRQQGRPDKQLYRLTAEGRRALAAWLEQPLEPGPDSNLLLLKLFFGDLAGPEALIEQVRARRKEVERFRAELEVIDSEVSSSRAANDLYPRLTRMYGFAWADAVIAWAEAAERELAREAEGARK